jgi:hypothetical protein
MHHRPAPVVDALLALLKQDTTGIGVTTAELAQRMGKSTVGISAKLSRMRAYGYVSRTPGPLARQPSGHPYPHEKVRWKVRD